MIQLTEKENKVLLNIGSDHQIQPYQRAIYFNRLTNILMVKHVAINDEEQITLQNILERILSSDLPRGCNADVFFGTLVTARVNQKAAIIWADHVFAKF